jgi:hypothetical protein
MQTIYKYLLNLSGSQIIETHEWARPLHVGYDPQGAVCIWFQVDTNFPTKKKIAYIVGTGNEIPPSATNYIGSFNQNPFVWHVYTN